MKVTQGLVSGGSGSYGRSVWSHNSFGSYIRSRAVPVNPNTSFQQAVRSYLALLASRWTTILNSAQRAAWETFAANVSVLDKLGQSINLSGLNWYLKSNVLRLQSGDNIIDDGPTTYALATLTPVTITVTEASQNLSIAFTNTDDWADTVGGHLYVFASRPQQFSINFFAGPYRLAGSIDGAATPPTSPAVIATPFPVVAGQKQFYRVVAVNQDGRPSGDFRTFDVVG